METLSLQNASMRIRTDYIEMPGLKLTLSQVARLCDLPRDVCEAAVSSLVTSGFLSQAGDGRFLRSGLGPQADGILAPRSAARRPFRL